MLRRVKLRKGTTMEVRFQKKKVAVGGEAGV
jgi:hypothetical protein